MAVPEVLLVVVGVLVLVGVLGAVRTVPAGHVGIVERRGRPHRTASPGVVAVLPLVDRLARLVDLREQVLTLAAEPLVDRDHLVHVLDVRVWWSVRDPVAATTEVADVGVAVRDLTRATARHAVGALPTTRVEGHEAWVGRQLHQVVDDAVRVWGLDVARVEVERAQAL